MPGNQASRWGSWETGYSQQVTDTLRIVGDGSLLSEKGFKNTERKQASENSEMLDWNWRYLQVTHGFNRYRNNYRYMCVCTHTYAYVS